MIRRALTPILAALALTATMAACTPGGTPGGGGSNVEDTAVEFMEAYAAGDDATMCELADREVGDCTTSASVEVEDDPEAGETFDNEEAGTTAVIVTYTATEPHTFAVEVKADGKVTQWEEMSGQPKNRETVAMVLEWSE